MRWRPLGMTKPTAISALGWPAPVSSCRVEWTYPVLARTYPYPHAGEWPQPLAEWRCRARPAGLQWLRCPGYGHWGSYHGGSLGSLFRFPFLMNRVAVFVGEGRVLAMVATMVTVMVPLPC
jgi:hypothetical protein